jgi:mRNA interferase RelE/StbE
MYHIGTASRRVDREIAALPPAVAQRVAAAVRALALEPRPPGVAKLAGHPRGGWRIRVGDYRILYEIDDEQQLVTIFAVLHRREAYR